MKYVTFKNICHISERSVFFHIYFLQKNALEHVNSLQIQN